MSWTISSLKESAHMAFKANYWPCVGAALVSVVASGGCNFRFKLNEEEASALTSSIDFSSPVVWAVLAAILLGVVVFAALFRLLLLNPLAVGCNGFFVDNSQGQAEFSAIAAPFRTDWKRTVKTMFLRDLLLFIWILPSALLAAGSVLYTMKRVHDVLSGAHQELVFLEFLTPMMLVAALAAIPFLVKTYSYRLVPWLIARDETLSGRAAIDRSTALMDGHKFHAFLLDLSFLGWYILGLFTCGLLYIFFVFPYKASANAELYIALASPSSPSPDPTIPPPLPDPFLP